MTSPSAGIGLRSPHLLTLFDHIDKINWLEVHTENLMVDGGVIHHAMSRLVETTPVSFHGIGLSLGSADGICMGHVQKIKKLIKQYDPILVSEHVSWNQVGGLFMNDLLPVPYTEEALEVLTRNIKDFQHEIGRQVLVENPSSYLEFKDSTLSEADFMVELAKRAECKILLDINNIYVSCENHGWDANAYIDAIPGDLVGEYHLAGHADVEIDQAIIKIDDHGSQVPDPVWDLYQYALKKIGPHMSLVEWDTNIPPIETLLNIAQKADKLISKQMEKQSYALAS